MQMCVCTVYSNHFGHFVCHFKQLKLVGQLVIYLHFMSKHLLFVCENTFNMNSFVVSKFYSEFNFV